MRLDRWEHQWLRAWRWHARALAATGRETGRGSLDAEDFAEALVQAVWHLKDWLKNDPRQTSVTAADIENHVSSVPVLCVIADLCNGSKHLEATRYRRAPGAGFGNLMWEGDGDPDEDASIERVWVTVVYPGWEGQEPDGWTRAPLPSEGLTGGLPWPPAAREVADVALEALEEWERWLAERGLFLPPVPGRRTTFVD